MARKRRGRWKTTRNGNQWPNQNRPSRRSIPGIHSYNPICRGAAMRRAVSITKRTIPYAPRPPVLSSIEDEAHKSDPRVVPPAGPLPGGVFRLGDRCGPSYIWGCGLRAVERGRPVKGAIREAILEAILKVRARANAAVTTTRQTPQKQGSAQPLRELRASVLKPSELSTLNMDSEP
jgi:hypothetical protein